MPTKKLWWGLGGQNVQKLTYVVFKWPLMSNNWWWKFKIHENYHSCKRFEPYNSLIKHKNRIHAEEKPLKKACERCGKIYLDPKALRQSQYCQNWLPFHYMCLSFLKKTFNLKRNEKSEVFSIFFGFFPEFFRIFFSIFTTYLHKKNRPFLYFCSEITEIS